MAAHCSHAARHRCEDSTCICGCFSDPQAACMLGSSVPACFGVVCLICACGCGRHNTASRQLCACCVVGCCCDMHFSLQALCSTTSHSDSYAALCFTRLIMICRVLLHLPLHQLHCYAAFCFICLTINCTAMPLSATSPSFALHAESYHELLTITNITIFLVCRRCVWPRLAATPVQLPALLSNTLHADSVAEPTQTLPSS
jgi:hypothetical protein